jgi:hypothetical protein
MVGCGVAQPTSKTEDSCRGNEERTNGPLKNINGNETDLSRLNVRQKNLPKQVFD